MIDRRDFLNKFKSLSALGMGSALGLSTFQSFSSTTSLTGYKALVVVHLSGGCDGNDILVPMDTKFNDYSKARPGLGLSKDMLTPLSGSYYSYSMGLNSALAPLKTIFDSGSLAFLINVGALIKPTTASDVLSKTATLPPFLFSHPEQTQVLQGWGGLSDPSGWGGRGMEALDPASLLRSPLIKMGGGNTTLVKGQHSRYVVANNYATDTLGLATITNPNDPWNQILNSLSRLSSVNNLEAEYLRTFKNMLTDSKELALADKAMPEPSGNFDNTELSSKLRMVAKLLPYYQSVGASRQIISVEYGGFDTHTSQRYSNSTLGNQNLDYRLSNVASALTSFNTAINKAGLANNVVVLVQSEFGRSLDPAAGLGSDHAWGNHWMLMGKSVNGGRMYGNAFPSLLLGGPDDGSDTKRGFWVPQISSDQIGSDLLTWLGLDSSQLTTVFPNLVNFNQKTIGFLS